MNNLLKDFKIQPTKLRGENMEKEIQILTRYEDPTIKQLQQELTNLKAIEKEHQRMNGELREEVKGYQQMYFDKVLIINKALTKIDNMFDNGDEFTIIDDLLELDKILKGDKHEQ